MPLFLNKNNLEHITSAGVEKPGDDIFFLPEKVLQFGTGVLLRGLPDYYIDKANKQKLFNGRVVMVKSTDSGDVDAFEKQDNLYTILIRGTEQGKFIEKNIINASVSRVLSAKKDWNKILECAASIELQVIISNTTEVGIQLIKDNINASPPVSFPGKLLAFLYQRYKIFNGDADKGLVIIPTELIVDNGKKLLEILLELAQQNKLENYFLDWLKNANDFCNSLVDRIVPGKPNFSLQKETEKNLGYADDLTIMAEPYNLWAIETANKKVTEKLSFSKTDDNIFIVPHISVFRELKLRLLNGAHTLSCGLACLAGFTTVKEAMNNIFFNKYISNLMYKEIAAAIANNNISMDEATAFASKVLDRFLNPYIEHQWLHITLQYSSKMAMRNVSTIKKFIDRFKEAPASMALGFAGYLLFTKPVKVNVEKYYGLANNKEYLIADNKADFYYDLWQNNNVHDVVKKSLANENIWGSNLLEIKGFAQAVENNLMLLMKDGALKVIEDITM